MPEKRDVDEDAEKQEGEARDPASTPPAHEGLSSQDIQAKPHRDGIVTLPRPGRLSAPRGWGRRR